MKLSWKKILICIFAIIIIAVICFLAALRNTDIPKLYLDGDFSWMTDKSVDSDIVFRYVDGNREESGYALIKLQGTSSLSYDKKNYTLKFYKDKEHDEKLNLDVGWGPQNKYCMKANWIDRTHARNVVTARLAAKMQAKYDLMTQAPNYGLIDGFPVEIYSNGKFLGLYTFNIPKDAWQFGMNEEDPNHIVICGENWEPACLFMGEPDFETWSVEVGEESPETLEKMNRLFDFVMNSSDDEFREKFGDYLNLDSALNYYIMTDLAYLSDNCGKNMLIATYDGAEWYLSLYDLDTSWGTMWDGASLYGYDEELLEINRSNLFARMETAFSQELAQRYFELRADILSNESIMAEFEAFREDIPALTFVKEAIRWSEDKFYRREGLPGADYDQIEEYLNTVSERLDAKYAAWLQ